VTPNSKVAGKPLKKIHFPRNTLVGAVVRGDNVIIPGGEDIIRVGDSLIVFARTETIPKLVNMF
jgi:trk system potassium uptake protein TrkA